MWDFSLLLFDSIEDAITELLQNAKVALPKENYFLGKIATAPSKQGGLPAIAIYDADVSFEEQTLGSNVREERQESVETFTADGEMTSFSLSKRPLKPLKRVESPAGILKHENEDFIVNYEKGELSFNVAPGKGGRKNVIVSYFPLQGASLISGLQVKAKYNLDIWAAKRDTCNDLMIDVVSAIILGRDKLASKGIVMKPLSASPIDLDIGSGGFGTSLPFGRRLSCSLDTDLYIATPLPAIERIELKKKEFESS